MNPHVPNRSHAPWLGAGVLVAALVVALGVAVPAGRVEAKPHPAPAAAKDKPIKTKIIALKDVKRSIKSRKGKVLLLHFWATWCGPCLQELPAMNKFAADMRPRGLEVLSLSLDSANEQGAQKVASMLQEKAPNLTATIVKVDDPSKFINMVDANWEGNIPAVFAFDPKGEMRGRYIGSASPRELTELVGYMLKPKK